MGRNRKSKALSRNGNGFEHLDSRIAELSAQKSVAIEKALYSNDPQQIVRAQNYLSKQKEKQPKTEVKSWLFMPDDYAYSGKGYKETVKGVTFDHLKAISKLFVVKMIHGTRIDQVKNFLAFSTDEQKEGFTIRKKKSLFDTETGKLNKSEEKEVTRIVKFLESCGNNSKWDNYDDFIEFVTKIMKDSLTYDQLAFENIRSRNGELQKFISVDASMVRILDSIDPRYQEQFKGMEWNGYLPKYCMSYNGQILENPVSGRPIIYYPWELGYGVRNKSTDVLANGYGVGELETGMELITWIIWSFQYNGNFFKQGSQPKGFINIKDGGGDNTTLNDFRNSWRQMMQGVHNSHKIPVFESIDLEWVDLQQSNKDMEFNQWLEFLIVVFCSVYRIDPTELGFEFNQASKVFGQDGQKERLDHSKKKGLKPLLIFLEGVLNKYIISELSEDYELKFTGIDVEDEEAQVDLDAKKLKEGMVAFEDMFKKYSGRSYNEKTDTILNQVFQQAEQAKQFGNPEMNDMVDDETGEGEGEGEEQQNPFEEFGKAAETDPIIKSSLEFINKTLS